MRSKADIARELVRLGNERSFNTLRGFDRERLESMLAHAERVTEGLEIDPPPWKHFRAVHPCTAETPMLSILDAPSELSESEQEESETPTDCTPYPVYVPAPISRWWDKWVDLALRPFSVALGVFGIV